jgi:hypothetical protein
LASVERRRDLLGGSGVSHVLLKLRAGTADQVLVAGDDDLWVVLGRGGETVSIALDDMVRLVDALKQLPPEKFPRARSDADHVAVMAAAARPVSEAPLRDVGMLDTPAIRHVAARMAMWRLLDVLDGT